MPKKLFVGNLPFNADERQLLAWFRNNGFPADSANISVDNWSGQPRGFGIVEMNERLAEKCVLACNGQDFLGRALIVNPAAPTQRMGSSGRRTRD